MKWRIILCTYIYILEVIDVAVVVALEETGSIFFVGGCLFRTSCCRTYRGVDVTQYLACPSASHSGNQFYPRLQNRDSTKTTKTAPNSSRRQNALDHPAAGLPSLSSKYIAIILSTRNTETMSSASTATDDTTATTPTTIHRQGVTLPLLTDDVTSWYQSSLVTVQQMTKAGLQLLLQTSYTMQQLVQQNQTKKKTKKNSDTALLTALSQQVVGTIFYEASTRTSCSFQTAALRLSGSYIHIDGMGNTSTGKKGETLYDTIRCIQCYTDAIVLRHPVTGSIYTILQQQQQQQNQRAHSVSPAKPIINAGDGIGEHPTQALLDVYTMYTEYIIHRCQRQVPATFIVVMLGDLKHGRTVHSLIQLLMSSTRDILYTDQLIIRCCAPNDSLQLPADIITSSITGSTESSNMIELEYYTDPLLACRDAHVLYVTRIQRERFSSDDDYNTVKVRF